jgi:hypothetical protein
MESTRAEREKLEDEQIKLDFAESRSHPFNSDAAQLFNRNTTASVLPSIELIGHILPGESNKKGTLEDQHWTLPLGANSANKKKTVPMEAMDKPDDKLPNAWEQPAASFMDGKCGITGVSNMLRFYGVEKDPKELDSYDYRSWGPGLRADKFRDNLNTLSGKNNFSAASLSKTDDALATLRKNLNEGKPVAIQFMTDSTNAHWVVVTGINDEKSGPELQVMSWGSYYKIKWSDLDDPWKRGYGGPYPHVVCDNGSEILKRRKN